MSARFTLLLGVTLLALSSPPLRAQSPQPAGKVVPSPVTGRIVPKIPLGMQREVTVVLELTAEPVSLVRSRMPDRKISASDKSSVERTVRREQDGLKSAIASQGVKVLATYQHAINGIKVRATPPQIAALGLLPGVVAIRPVTTYKATNATSVPFIGAPAAWGGSTVPGLRGERIRIAIIDSGLDYTHANFGGPGTPSAFQLAFATSDAAADPSLFGPAAPKVKGGIDLVGNEFDSSSSDPVKRVPRPDPNPLDCSGHGSHIGGTAAGFGVTSSGATFRGPYDASTAGLPFRVGPGVAPLADLYAVRVLGCSGSGSTDLVIDALEWAVKNDMQVVNMSLGAGFGSKDSADAAAAGYAVKAGVVVIASSGNDGHSPYITGSPGTGERVVSVAAMDALPTVSGFSLALDTGQSIFARNLNGVTVPNNTLMQVVTLRNPDGSISYGCDENEYVGLAAGRMVVTLRGVCSRINRAIYGARWGARAVVMINDQPGYPGIEGPIPGVQIPFLGVAGDTETSSDGTTLSWASLARFTGATNHNPTFRTMADFSSSGPRTGDGHLKPNVTAPGVAIVSTGIATGNASTVMSGSSMATPHVTGVAALVLQAHPTWDADEIGAAIVNTASAAPLAGYTTRLAGSGVVQALAATRTSVIARGEKDSLSLSFGVEEFTRDFDGHGVITLENLGSKAATFQVTVNATGGLTAHTVKVEQNQVTVSPKQKLKLPVRVKIPAETVGDSSAFHDVAGLITFTPTSASANGGAVLTLPYYVVPRARSEVDAQGKHLHIGSRVIVPTVTLRNQSPKVTGTADTYAWGLRGRDKYLGPIGIRSVGVQSVDIGGQVLIFAVNTFKPWSNAAAHEFDIVLDVNGDGVADFQVVAVDLGAITTGEFNGQVASAVIDLATFTAQIRFMATAPTDGNTILLPALASDLGITPSNPRFAYTAQSFDLFSGAFDLMDTTATFNAFESAIATGTFLAIGPRERYVVPVRVNMAELEITPPLGLMIVALENPAKGPQGQVQLQEIHDTTPPPPKPPKDPKPPKPAKDPKPKPPKPEPPKPAKDPKPEPPKPPKQEQPKPEPPKPAKDPKPEPPKPPKK